MKPKGKTSVRKAVQVIYPGLPRIFSMITLHRLVGEKIERPQVFPDTVARKLRELREEGLVSYECIDRLRSWYRKTEYEL